MIALHQVLVGATPGDAITRSALIIRQLLRRVADSEIFALFLDEGVGSEIRPLNLFDEWCADRNEEAVILFHASMGHPDMRSFLLERPEPLILIYHNLSPAAPFLPYDPSMAGRLSEGRRELEEIRDRVVLSLADSTFNADELRELGYRDVRVSPLQIELDELLDIESDPELTAELESKEGPIVLFVGQLLPHKRPDLVIQAFNVFSTYHSPQASLKIVGPHRLINYRDAVKRFLDELNLPSAQLLGPVSPSELVTYYRCADVFMTMSDHEGFCVPLIEAMAFGVPVVARSMGAIPETAGDAALLLGTGEDPILAGEALTEMTSNEELRRKLVDRGLARASEFGSDEGKVHFLENIMSVL